MKKLIRKRQRFEGITLGLDLHKQFTQFCVLDAAGDELVNDRVAGDRQALDGLLDRVTAEANDSPVQVVIEACRCFRWVYELLCARLGDEHVHVAVSHKVSAIASSGEKTDANDAWWLAYLAWDGRLPTANVVTGALYEIRTACRERRSTIQSRTSLILRVVSQLAQQGLYLGHGKFATMDGQARVWSFVKSLPESMVRESLERALALIAILNAEVDHWDARLKKLCEGEKLIETVESWIPGVGLLTSASVVSELGDPREYGTAKAYAKAVGVTPGYRSSGGRSRAMGISRSGSAQARWSLIHAIAICLNPKHQKSRSIRLWVERQSRRKPKKVAMVAAARKLAEAIWRLFQYGEAFDLDRAFAT